MWKRQKWLSNEHVRTFYHQSCIFTADRGLPHKKSWDKGTVYITTATSTFLQLLLLVTMSVACKNFWNSQKLNRYNSLDYLFLALQNCNLIGGLCTVLYLECIIAFIDPVWWCILWWTRHVSQHWLYSKACSTCWGINMYFALICNITHE